MLDLYDISVNATKNPSFIPTSNLTLSWKLRSDKEDVFQEAYQITFTEKGQTVPFYTSGFVKSSRSVHVPIACELKTGTDYEIAIDISDNHCACAHAAIAVGTAIAPTEWEAMWIKPSCHIAGWAPYLRTKFIAGTDVASAKLYVCGLGCGEYYINGQKICEDFIDPPFTNYECEVLYRIYDVTDFIVEKNAFVALLGDGWYSQSRVWGPNNMKYGDVCLLARLEICYADGHTQVITTDTEAWTYKYSPISLNNLYGGETYDCRLETPDFSLYEGCEDGWCTVIEDKAPRGELKLCEMAPVRIIRTIPAVSVTHASGQRDGAWIIDFGENVSGVACITIPEAPRGAQYVLRFAETVNPDGTLDYRSTGAFATQCIQQDIYIARGDKGGETWTPRFTYHGFRYMEITGYHDLRAYGMEPDTDFAKLLVLSTDLRSTGSVTTSNADINKLHSIMMTTFLSNYHGFPEDCPVRERCGWLGDAQIVCNTGIMNFDLEAAYTKYISDMRTSDKVYGVWQMIAPGRRGCGEASPLWGCANIIMPYYMYQYYGNESIVRNNWATMEKWVRHEIDDAKNNIAETGSAYIITRGLGDWCNPGGNSPQNPRRMPVEESSTAMFYEIAIRMDELSRELSLPCSTAYALLASSIKDAYISRFWKPDLHRYGTWGSCGVALMLGLYPDGEKENLQKALVSLIASDDYAMPTGIYCNKYLVPALAECGHGDDALRFLFNRNHTSFGTMLDDGATSLFEDLELRMIDHPHNEGVSSYNHPMHSGFAYFLYSCVAGIRPLKPAFAEFAVEPCHFTDIPSATVSHDSPYGEIKIAFSRTEQSTSYTITVPPNTVAHFGGKKLTSGTHTIKLSTLIN